MIRTPLRVRYLLPPVGAVIIAIATACSNGGGGGATGGTGGGATGGTGGVEPITVTITPTPAGVLTCSTTQFSATITGTTDLSGTWSMTPATGAGTFDDLGTYHAPTATPAAPNNIVTVTATSAADPSAFDATPAFTLATAFPSTAVPIPSSTGDLEPDVAIGVYQHAAASSGNTVYAVWSVNSDPTEVKMMIAHSIDGGATWSAGVAAIDALITDGNGGSVQCPAVAVDAGDRNIVYATGMVSGSNSYTHAHGDPTNDPAFILAVSTDGGATFSQTILSTAYAGISACQDVASPAPNTVVVNASTGDQCGTYPDITVWTDTAGGAGFQTGQIDNANGYYWADGISTALYILRGSSDCLTDLAAEANASQDASGGVIESPRMFTDRAGHLCLTYAAESPTATPVSEDVYIQCSSDAGKTYTQPMQLDANLGDANQPNGAFGPRGLAAVVWTHYTTGDQQLYLAVSTDGAATFGAPIVVPTSSVPYSPSVYIDADGVIWISYMMAPTSAQYYVYVDKSCDKGATFSGAAQLQGNASFGVIAPSLLGTAAAAPIVVGLEDTQHVAYSLSP